MRVAVLGCGSIGRRHIGNLRAVEGLDVLAFDIDPAACSHVFSTPGTRTTSRLADIWDWDPNVVLVCTPTNTHIPLARQAVERGSHLFLEKPLSHSLDGVDALERELKGKRLVSMVGCNMRFHPGPALVRRLLKEGAIGDLVAMRIQTGSYLPRWRPNDDYTQSYSASPESGGAILDCIHEIDLALWYAGSAQLRCALVRPASSIGLTTDGIAELLLQHDSGTISAVHVNFVQRDYRRACQLIGSKGTIYWDFEGKSVGIFGEDGTKTSFFPEPQDWKLNDMYMKEIPPP